MSLRAVAVLLCLAALPARADEAPPPLPSLLSAAPLAGGGAVTLFTAGLPFLTAAYAQGVDERLDLGAELELDWLSTEWFAGGLARWSLGREGNVDLALRGRVGLYRNSGADYVFEENVHDTGIQVAPGAIASIPLQRGTVALTFDIPLTITWRRGGGLIAAPRLAAAFETPITDELSAGARVGGFWVVAGGDAPFADDSRNQLDFAAVLTWRIF